MTHSGRSSAKSLAFLAATPSRSNAAIFACHSSTSFRAKRLRSAARVSTRIARNSESQANHVALKRAPALPDLDALDHEALKALLLAQHQQHFAKHDKYTAHLASRSTEIAHLKLTVDKLRRMLFGVKSEKVLRQVEQLELQLDELEIAYAAEDQVVISDD